MERFGNEGADHQKKMGDCVAKRVFFFKSGTPMVQIYPHMHFFGCMYAFGETNLTLVFFVFSVSRYLISCFV